MPLPAQTEVWINKPQQIIAPYPCEAVVEVICPKVAVPSHLPGKNVSNVLTRAEDCDISIQAFSKTSDSKCDLINKASHL